MMKIDVATGQLSCKFRVYGVERLHETCRFTRDTPRIYSRNSHSPGSLAGPSSPPLPSPPRVITGGTSVRRIRVKTLTSRLSSARSKAHNSFSPRPVSEQKACNARKMLAPDSKLFRSSVITSLGLPPSPLLPVPNHFLRFIALFPPLAEVEKSDVERGWNNRRLAASTDNPRRFRPPPPLLLRTKFVNR